MGKRSKRRLEKHVNWPERLADYIFECRHRKFEYGKWDCCLFVFEAIERMVGVHIMKEAGHVGKYKTERGAKRLMPNGMKAVIEDALALFENYHEVAKGFTGRGDLGILNINGVDTAVINCGGKWLGPGANGPEQAFGEFVCAWRIG